MKTETQNFWQGVVGAAVGTAANVFGTISVSQRDADTKVAVANTQAVAGLVKFVIAVGGVVAFLVFIFKKL